MVNTVRRMAAHLNEIEQEKNYSLRESQRTNYGCPFVGEKYQFGYYLRNRSDQIRDNHRSRVDKRSPVQIEKHRPGKVHVAGCQVIVEGITEKETSDLERVHQDNQRRITGSVQ